MDETAALPQQRKVGKTPTYSVGRMVDLIDRIVANLSREIDNRRTMAQLQAEGAGQEAARADAKAGKGKSGKPAAPMTLGETLQRLLLPPDLLAKAGLPADKKLTPDQCRHILAACAKLLPTPMEFDPSQYNKAQPDQPDAVDHDPTIPQTYLKNMAAALTLTVSSLPPPEARIIHAILESMSNKIQELDPKNLGPTVVASKPGDKMNFALGSYFPPNPMAPPSKD